MRLYETVFIMVPDLPDEERDQIINRYKSVLVDNGAEMLNLDDWGRRRLAYEIKKQTKGHYVLFEHTAEPKAVSEMERQMRLDDQIIRFLTVKVADAYDPAIHGTRPEGGAARKPEDEEGQGDGVKPRADWDDESGPEDEWEDESESEDGEDKEGPGKGRNKAARKAPAEEEK